MHRADGGFFQRFKSLDAERRVPRGKILAAVSGGADSVAMLHALWRLRRETKREVVVAHVQHNLRGRESERNERFVETLSERLHLKFMSRSVSVRDFARRGKMGIEESARVLRYRALGDMARASGARTIAVAHNANDQAETLLLNILRGTGIPGLCGMRVRRPLKDVTGRARDARVALYRPMLAFSRDEIMAYVRSQNLKFFQDRSNRSLVHRRNWVRRKLIPLMETVQPRIVRNLVLLSTYAQSERLDGDSVKRYDLSSQRHHEETTTHRH